MKPLRVLQVIDALGMGGAETWLMEVLRLWAKNNRGQIDFLITSGNRGVFDDEAQRLGAKVFYVRYGRAHLRHFGTKFRHILKTGAYNAIHDHADYTSGWHFLFGGTQLPPVRVTHIHNAWIHIQENYAVTPVRRLTTFFGKQLVNTLATNVCGTSASILREYGFQPRRAGCPSISVLHCGFDIGRFNKPREADRQSLLHEFSWEQDTKVVLFAGRLDRQLEFNHPQNVKNSWFALNVARIAAATDPSVRLLMAGEDNNLRREIVRHIKKWGLEGKIHVIGVRRDIDRLMRGADVLLFPSQQEGLGMVAVEAQAACLPVLSSSAVPRECVVIPELYNVMSLNEPIEHWAAALLNAISKARPPLELCRQALERSPFAIANSAEQLENIYRQGDNVNFSRLREMLAAKM